MGPNEGIQEKFSVERLPSFVLFLSIATLFLSFITVYIQVDTLGTFYITQGNQIKRHLTIIEGTAINPWQYRILSEYLLHWIFGFLKALNIPHGKDILLGFVGFRILQNISLYFLAGWFYHKIGVNTYGVLVGLCIMTWSLIHALYNSDLSFNTYFDCIFYLMAALATVYQKNLWIIPITALAALNRETSGLIPFMFLAYHLSFKPTLTIPKNILTIGSSAFIIYLMFFWGIRAWYGETAPFLPYHRALYVFSLNVSDIKSYIHIVSTLTIIPIISILILRQAPYILQAFFWVIVPIWFVVHIFGSVIAETRLLLVPQIVVFIPLALYGICQQMVLQKKT